MLLNVINGSSHETIVMFSRFNANSESVNFCFLGVFLQDGEESVASWELRVEGRLLDEVRNPQNCRKFVHLQFAELSGQIKRVLWVVSMQDIDSFVQNAKNLPNDPNKPKRKFSSFFKSLVIELDKDLYGPDNHLVEVSCSLLFFFRQYFASVEQGYCLYLHAIWYFFHKIQCSWLMLLHFFSVFQQENVDICVHPSQDKNCTALFLHQWALVSFAPLYLETPSKLTQLLPNSFFTHNTRWLVAVNMNWSESFSFFLTFDLLFSQWHRNPPQPEGGKRSKNDPNVCILTFLLIR